MRTNRCLLAGCFIVSLLVASLTGLRGEESPQERIARIEAMSAAEKEELAQKKKRFDELTPVEKERLRKLHAEVSVRADKAQLESVMQHYHDWLKTLSTNQLALLRGMPEAERLEYIKRIVTEQQKQAWRKLAEQASPEDLDTIYEWLAKFVDKHRDKLAIGELAKRVAALDKDRQTLVLIHLMQANRFPGALRPGRAEVEQLLEDLSPAAQNFFQETSEMSRRSQLISIWSRAAWWSKAFPNVNSEQLANFYEQLPAEERDRLESLPTVDRDSELRLLYARANFLRRGELGRGSGRGVPRGGRPNPDPEKR